VDGQGRISGVWQEACPLWRGLDQLDAAVARIQHKLEGRTGCHAITMTGEMTDLFADREAGVGALANTMVRHLSPASAWFFAAMDGWVRQDTLQAHSLQVASANWYATARLLATRVPDALLVDIGSTTTDIIPLREGRVASLSLTDADRLDAGELVYTGVVRTPVMALTHQAPVAGRWRPLMAEHFATTADIYRILGWLPEHADQMDSADGGPKTLEASRRRLARMVGMDVAGQSELAWRELAAWCAQAQLASIERGIRLVLSRLPAPTDMPLVMAGAGAFLGKALGQRLERPVVEFHSVFPGGTTDQGWCAPAVSVARLLYEDKICT